MLTPSEYDLVLQVTNIQCGTLKRPLQPHPHPPNQKKTNKKKRLFAFVLNVPFFKKTKKYSQCLHASISVAAHLTWTLASADD